MHCRSCRCLMFGHRRPDHLLDARGAGRQHHQPVEAERDAAGRRHLRERGEEILVDRIALAVDALLLGHLRLEARGAARPDRSVRRSHWRARRRRHRARSARRRADRCRLRPRQRRLGSGYSYRMVARPIAELRLDPLDQDAAEDVGPGVVGGDADAGRCAAARRARRGRPARRCERRQQVDAGIAREGLGDGEPLRRGERIDGRGRETRTASRPPSRAAAPAAPRSRPSASRRARRPGTIRAG